jgi:hypothetical protein
MPTPVPKTMHDNIQSMTSLNLLRPALEEWRFIKTCIRIIPELAGRKNRLGRRSPLLTSRKHALAEWAQLDSLF